METKHDLGISVKIKNGDVLRLEPHENDMYHLDLEKLMNNSKPKNLVTNYCLL